MTDWIDIGCILDPPLSQISVLSKKCTRVSMNSLTVTYTAFCIFYSMLLWVHNFTQYYLAFWRCVSINFEGKTHVAGYIDWIRVGCKKHSSIFLNLPSIATSPPPGGPTVWAYNRLLNYPSILLCHICNLLWILCPSVSLLVTFSGIRSVPPPLRWPPQHPY